MAATPLSRSDIENLDVTVMGLGLHGGGLESARFFARAGARVTVTDLRSGDILAPSMEALRDLPVRYVLGRHDMEDFERADLVVKNPAVRSDSPYLRAARRIETDISVFLRLSRSPLVAVTGTKGKSTTASAIHHGLVRAGFDAFLGGNITVSPLTFVDSTSPERPVVLELSSWQLADLRGLGILKPRVAVLTAIMPDHMNRYSSMEEYIADKRLIYADQDAGDCTVCDADQDWGLSFARETRARVLRYSTRRHDDPGGWLEDAEHSGCTGPRGFFQEGSGRDVGEVVPATVTVRGAHQRKNLLAAACALKRFGLDAPTIRSAMGTFRGVEHRMESFAEKDGIAWINDSASTVPQAVDAALGGFEGPVILITGGTDKNLDFEPVYRGYSRAKHILLLEGTGTAKLRPLLERASIPFEGPFPDLESAVGRACLIARPGDSVLLSPGCTSFGMFLHEFDRGRRFKDTVRRMLDLDERRVDNAPIVE